MQTDTPYRRRWACGCVSCICEHDEQCQGCGARRCDKPADECQERATTTPQPGEREDNPSAETGARERLRLIASIIEAVDARCMAADGPVTPTLSEMTQYEIGRIYALATAGDDESGRMAPETQDVVKRLSAMLGHYGDDLTLPDQVALTDACEGLRTLTRELAEARAENRILRELLAFAYSGARYLYTDDGELADSRRPLIDYRRDTAEQIRAAIQERARAALAPAQEVRS